MKWRIAIALSFSLILLFACKPKPEPITAAEASAFGKSLEKETMAGLPDKLNTIFDQNTFADNVVDAMHDNSFGVKQAVKEKIKELKLGNEIVKGKGDEGLFSLLKQYEKDGKQHLLYRLCFNDGGLNYYDFELAKFNGQIKAADVYVYLSGEMFSKSIGTLLSSVLGEKSSDKNIEAIQKMSRLLKAKEYDRAMKVYATLPASIQKEKTVQLIYIRICEGISNDVYLKALNEYEAAFPNEPNIYLMMIDKYFLDKKYKETLEMVDKLDGLINKDPFLDFYRSNLSDAMGNTADAILYCERLVKNMPTYDRGMLQLIILYESEGQHEKAKAIAKQYAANDTPNKANKLQQLYVSYPKLKG